MKALLAFDKFKDALSAAEAGEAAAHGLAEADCGAAVELCPLTDGGEGFAEILGDAVGARTIEVDVRDARGRPVRVPVRMVAADRVPFEARAVLDLPGLAGTDEIALVGMASASGLASLPMALRDPWRTCSVGTGEAIAAAVTNGARSVVVGIGGSATHDLGLGCLTALGWSVVDRRDREIEWPSPDRWTQIRRLVSPAGPGVPLRVACDVDNPLVGPRGAARVYAPQKGARPPDLQRLEDLTVEIGGLICRAGKVAPETMSRPGMGAAGGMAFGLHVLAGAKLVPGSALVNAWLRLPERIAAADIVLTGEGRFDASSLEGKGPGAVAQVAVAAGKPVIFFAGAATISAPPPIRLEVITPANLPLDIALSRAADHLRLSVRTVFTNPLPPP